MRLHHDIAGDGPTLVLVHGWGGSAAMFARQLDGGLAGLRVIAPDLRGHGRTPDPGDGHGISTMAADVHELLERLGVERCVLAGWSMGAAVVWSFLEQFGEDALDGVIIIDQPPRLVWSEDWPWGVEVDGGRFDPAEVARDRDGWVSGFLEAAAAELAPADRALVAAEMAIPRTETLVALLRDHLPRDWRPVVDRSRVPTLVIRGTSSPQPEPAIRWTAEHAHGPDLVTVRGDHFAFLEHPAAFNRAVLDFVKASTAG